MTALQTGITFPHTTPSFGTPIGDDCIALAMSVPRRWHQFAVPVSTVTGGWLGIQFPTIGVDRQETSIFLASAKRLVIAWDDATGSPGPNAGRIAHAVEMRAVYAQGVKLRASVFRFTATNVNDVSLPSTARDGPVRLTFTFIRSNGTSMYSSQQVSVVGSAAIDQVPLTPAITSITAAGQSPTGEEPVRVQSGSSVAMSVQGSALLPGRIGVSPRRVRLSGRRDSTSGGIHAIDFLMSVPRGARGSFRLFVEAVGGVTERAFTIVSDAGLPRFSGSKAVTPRPIRLGDTTPVAIPGTNLDVAGAELTVKLIRPGRKTRPDPVPILARTANLLQFAPPFTHRGRYLVRYFLEGQWSTSVRVRVK